MWVGRHLESFYTKGRLAWQGQRPEGEKFNIFGLSELKIYPKPHCGWPSTRMRTLCHSLRRKKYVFILHSMRRTCEVLLNFSFSSPFWKWFQKQTESLEGLLTWSQLTMLMHTQECRVTTQQAPQRNPKCWCAVAGLWNQHWAEEGSVILGWNNTVNK